MRSHLIHLIATVALTQAACTPVNVPDRYSSAAPIVAQASAPGMIAIAGQRSGTVRVLFARNGGMVLIKDIRLPAGQGVMELSLSADGRDLVIGTESTVYLASRDAWKLHDVGALTPGPLADAWAAVRCCDFADGPETPRDSR